MFSLEYDPSTVPVSSSVPVAVSEAGDLEGLLYAWLSELIWLHDAESFVPGRVAVDSLVEEQEAFGVSGAASGAWLGPWFEQTGPQLKAVTMHGLAVTRRGEEYVATVYVDV